LNLKKKAKNISELKAVGTNLRKNEVKQRKGDILGTWKIE
jgi:hypothetical protein